MRRIDEQCTDNAVLRLASFMVAVLRREGEAVNRKHVRRLMQLMGIEAIYQRPNTSLASSGPQGVSISFARSRDRPGQPGLVRGYHLRSDWPRDLCHLVAVMDWFSRRVLAWRLSISMETEFCVEALQDAMDRHGQAGHLQYRSGRTFTSAAFIDELAITQVCVSAWTARGGFSTTSSSSRLWRNPKYEVRCSIKAFTPRLPRHAAASAHGSAFTTTNGRAP